MTIGNTAALWKHLTINDVNTVRNSDNLETMALCEILLDSLLVPQTVEIIIIADAPEVQYRIITNGDACLLNTVYILTMADAVHCEKF